MTAVIGFSTKDSLIVASDSQITYAPSSAARTDVQKVVQVKFGSGDACLYAFSGYQDFANVFREHFEERARNTMVTDDETIRRVAQESLTETKNLISRCYSHPSYAEDATAKYLSDYHTEILLGYYPKGPPRFYKFKIHDGVLVRVPELFEAIGGGLNLAGAVLRDFPLANLSTIEAIGLAVYTIEFCNENDCNCGGPVQIGYYNKADNRCIVMERSTVAMFKSAVEETGRQSKEHLVQLIASNFTKRLLAEL